MSYSEALGLLEAAKPLIDQLKACLLSCDPNQVELEALEGINEVLKSFSYQPELLKQAGWTVGDVAFLHGRLSYYRSKSKVN